MTDSNRYLDDYEDIIHVPKREEVIRYNEEEHMRMLNDLESPEERLKTLYKSIFDIRTNPTHEAFWIRRMFFAGAITGFIVGGILKNRGGHEKYQRLHNASVFDNKFVGNRHFFDTLITSMFSRGIGYGFKTGIVTGSAALITFTSITYRNQLYLPDFLIGFGAFGGLSRLWLGPKAVLVGSGIGLVGGLLGYGFGKSFELLSGQTITQFRLIHHSAWLHQREAKLRRMQKMSEQNFKQVITSGDMR